MSWDLLKRFIESDVFNSNPFLSVSYLSRYADHVGIHYVLCNKLRQFPYEDIEFFLPQLCHLIISVDNESMALEEFLLDLCEESVTAALLTFWLFQTYLHDLSANPQTEAFRTCRRIYNKVQNVVFGVADGSPRSHAKITENVMPVMVLSSLVLSAVALPALPHWAGPLAVAQARRPKPLPDVISEVRPSGDGSARSQQQHAQNKIPARARTVAGTSGLSASSGSGSSSGSSRPRRSAKDESARVTSAPDPSTPSPAPVATTSADMPIKSPRRKPPRPASPSESSFRTTGRSAEPQPKRQPHALLLDNARLSTSSLPLPETAMSTTRPATPLSAGPVPARSHSLQGKKKAASLANGSPSGLSAAQRRRMLTQNYFRCETQFLSALEDISNRLVVVPKQARLSALRAELALIARDLPAEVDIPVICPPTLVDGSPGKSRHHRIVRLNPAEATVLNSAEKVPYLLIVEILRDDFSFDPDTHDNQRLLEQLLAEEKSGAPRRRIFDLSDAPRTPPAATSRAPEPAPAADSVFEPAAGDLGTSTPLVPADDVPSSADGPQPRTPLGAATRSMTPTTMPMHPGRVPSGTTTLSTLSDMTATTPRSSAGGASTSRSSSPGPPMRKAVAAAHMPNSRFAGSSGSLDMQQHPLPQPQQPDFSALATHMRTASQMLAQLEATSGKRPRHEVAAIRAKIIASMQSLEEQSFDLAADADGQGGPNFDLIMAKAAAAAAAEQSQASSTATTANGGAPPEDFDVDMGGVVEPAVNASAAGLARMENDFKTGGVGRKGDRDDPSAAVFGEAWHVKKERIRRSSPYGWMKNWDLVSVIVKTGADLRQEAFACQLISVCDRIWREAGVNVWVKRMRILVTGESSGLIETIANGVSLHSLKRSLTLSSIESGQNPRRRIATLRDHFAKVFGPADSEAYRAGVDAFKQSLAAYSVVSYVLQLKDRHNGNLLIDNEGHIIHIDFGFMLSNSPGSVGFEAAPFKLTHEYVEVLGGLGSPDFEDYKRLCKQAFQALRRSADNIVDLVSMMGKDSKMPCYAAGVVQVTAALRARFMLHLSADEAEQFVENDLIGKSFGSYYTRLYDTYQYRTQGIY